MSTQKPLRLSDRLKLSHPSLSYSSCFVRLLCQLFGKEKVQPHPEVRRQKPLTLLQLTAIHLGITHHQSRHKLGLSCPALHHQQNPLAFFGLLPSATADHPTMPAGWVTLLAGVEGWLAARVGVVHYISTC